MLPTEGNAHFLSGALGYTRKALSLGADLALTLAEKRTTGFPNVDKKREKIRTQLKETVRNVIPFNFPVTPPKQTCICNEGNNHKKRFAWLHLTCFSLSFCFVLHDWSHSRVWGLASSVLAGRRVQDWFWKKQMAAMMLGDFTIYHCSSLQMDQYPPPVLKSGCRYSKSVVKFFFSCFVLFFVIFSFRLLQGLAASSDWTFVFPCFLFCFFTLLLKVHMFFCTGS